MNNRLFIGVMGNRNSGKSKTWQTLFEQSDIRTGKCLRPLYFFDDSYVNVFLINGSPQEREVEIESLLPEGELPDIILCSMQYASSAKKTIKWALKMGYFLFIHWLNPGYKDIAIYDDDIGLQKIILDSDSMFGIRNGKVHLKSRTQEIKDYIYGWAKSRDFLNHQ